jgi:hypothetical protein
MARILARAEVLFWKRSASWGKFMRFSAWCYAYVLAAVLLGTIAGAQDPPPKGEAVVVDVEGHEIKLSNVKFSTGTRRLAWLADPKGSTEEARKGPLALEIRETQSTTFAKGVVTLIQLAHVESAQYDYEKQLARVRLKGLKEPLTATLQYKGINVLGLSGLVDGKATTWSAGSQGKSPVKALKSVTFSGASPLPEARSTGTTWSVKIVQPKAGDPTLTVRNLKLLYQFPGGIESLDDAIPVRKGAVLPLNGTVKRFEILATDTNTNLAAAEVETTTGPERVVIVPLTKEQDQKTGTLLGFLGEVEAGWKLFPLHTIKVISLTDVKKKVE